MRKHTSSYAVPFGISNRSHSHILWATAATTVTPSITSTTTSGGISWFPTVAMLRTTETKNGTMQQQAIGRGAGFSSPWWFASADTSFCEGASLTKPPSDAPKPRSEEFPPTQQQPPPPPPPPLPWLRELPPPPPAAEAPQEQQQRRRQQQQQQQQPCPTCRYTGTAVCAGLSLYFLRLATEDAATAAERWARTAAVTASRAPKPYQNKPFFYGGALVWAAAGIYRFSMADD